MRDTLAIEPEMNAAYQAYGALQAEHQSAPKSKKFAMFEMNKGRGGPNKWFGPYWHDNRIAPSNEANHLVRQYSWSITMVFSVDSDDIVHLVSDLKTPIPSRDELVEICKDLIASPQRQ